MDSVVMAQCFETVRQSFLFVMFLVMYLVGAKQKAEWVTSIRSLSTYLVIFTFCAMSAKGAVDPKDFMLIVSLVMNFYFLAKQRGTNGSSPSDSATK